MRIRERSYRSGKAFRLFTPMVMRIPVRTLEVLEVDRISFPRWV